MAFNDILPKCSIAIDGNPVNQFISFSLSQGIFEHQYFRLICRADAIDKAGGILSQSKKLLGTTLTAQINSLQPKTVGGLKFKGIVMNVEAEKFGNSDGDIVISGYSATVLLDSGPHCKTWEKKAIKNIAQDVLKHFPQNVLNPKINPIYPETLAYYTQYQETAWRLLHRICSTYGEWLYFDGERLVIGPPEGKTVPLIFGTHLSRFSLALQVRPANMQVMAYDYMNNQVYNSNPNSVESKAGLNDLGKEVYKASQAVYSSSPKMWNNHFLTNKKQLDDTVNIQAAMRSSNHVRFNGSSKHPGIAVAGKISVTGNSLSDGVSYGDYTVISVNH